MPMYLYRCKSCLNEREELQKFSDPPLTECPLCEWGQLERVITTTNFSLKGGGWYKDGYASKK